MLQKSHYRGVFYKYLFKLFPSYWATGAKILSISPDFMAVDIKLPLNLRTRNYYGTTFGGSMYSAIDPVYAMMVYHALDKRFMVWDKGATIDYKKPGRSTLYAYFRLNKTVLDEIDATLKEQHSTEHTFEIDLVDAQNVVHASFEKIIYIGHKK